MNTPTPPTPLANNSADARSAETLRMLLAIRDPWHRLIISIVVETLWTLHTLGFAPADTDQV